MTEEYYDILQEIKRPRFSPVFASWVILGKNNVLDSTPLFVK